MSTRTTTTTTMPSSPNNDEYTDYSCSTSIERLARDVETLLRSWHVDKGNDRHISILSSSNNNNHHHHQHHVHGMDSIGSNSLLGTRTATTCGTTAATSNSSPNYGVPSGDCSVASQHSTSTMSTTTTAFSTTAANANNTAPPPSLPPTLLLRSDTLTWNVSMTTPHDGRLISFTVELQLALWDAPSSSSADPSSISFEGTDGDHEHPNDGDSNSLHSSSSQEDFLSELPYALRRASVATMSPAWFENMSSLFGIGQHITLTPMVPRQLHSNTSGASSSSSDIFTQGELQFLAQSILNRHHDERTAKYALYQILSGWLQTALNCAVANCQCCIPIFGFWGIYSPNNDNTTNNPTRSRRKKFDKRPLRNKERAMRPGDLQVIPSWMEDILSAELPGLPRMGRQQFYNLRSAQNSQYNPPLLTGTVLPTVNTTGTFWCSVLPGDSDSSSKTATRTQSHRLSTWGSMLLQHCPDDTVVLHGARHVFCWWKQPLEKASTFQMLFQPDNYQYEHENNPYTAWRRRPQRQQQSKKTTKPKIISIDNNSSIPNNGTSNGNNHSLMTGTLPRQIIDLTGEDSDDDEELLAEANGDRMRMYYMRYEKYQDQCRSLAVALLDQAAGATATEPRWGPVDDPVAAIHATVTWNGSPSHNNNITGTPSTDDPSTNAQSNGATKAHQNMNGVSNNDAIPRQPLLSFPLRIRSKHTMSAEDWIEMEESVERTILDPLLPSHFQVQNWWDLETNVASLAATQQCILAALIRTSTLPDETLLKHITDDSVLEQWDNNAGNVVASCLAQKADVGPVTKALVEAMDWDTALEDKMNMRDAEILVRHILKPDNGSDFLTPPTSPLDKHNAAMVGASSPTHRPVEHNARAVPSSSAPTKNNVFAPLFKSAPMGRLVSILFVHMARIRSPCSMAMLWTAFCHEVRMRWEHGILLPHMNHVPGLDPSALEMKERNKCLNALGVKADRAAYWHGPPSPSSPRRSNDVEQLAVQFPGDHHCLIGQKLQVVNLCIELAAADENRRQEKLHKQGQQEQQQDKRRKLADRDLNAGYGTDTNQREAELKKKIEEANRKIAPDVTEEPSESSFSGLSVACFPGSDEATAIAAAAQRSMEEHRQSHQQQARKGARCWVPGSRLVQTGAELHAPYLQRPYPLTDDVIAERYDMLTRHYEPSRTSKHGLHRRLELSYRLQKPKLLSDMNAFKAANPGAIFQDFINWYGNPGNPLDDYNDTRGSANNGGTTIGDLVLGRSESVAIKMDKAHEAIQMLNDTREFWSATWEEATPVPACDQRLLFDVTSTVEMSLDFMENMHPAILVNQCMAVNLSVSYFTIMGAAKEAGLHRIGGLVKRTFQRLREKTELALALLSTDATRSTFTCCSDANQHEGSSSFVSLSAISACDVACSALSDAEVVTARATSLLHKFPDQYELVESILRHKPGHEVGFIDKEGRAQILEAIHRQQQHRLSHKKDDSKQKVKKAMGVRPALKEYVLRNLDDSCPCQLSVRYADESVMFNNHNRGGDDKQQGGMIIALTKSVDE